MRELNVLITACGSKTASHCLIESLAQSGRYRCRCFGIDLVEPRFAPRHLGYRRVPPSSEPGFVDAVGELCRKASIDVIFPLIEEDLLALSDPAGPLAGRVVGPRRDRAELLADKGRLLAALTAGGGRRIPRFRLLDAPDDVPAAAAALGYPEARLVVKPRRGRGSRGLVLLTAEPLEPGRRSFEPRYTPSELAAKLPASFSDHLVMEHLAGPDYTVFCFAVEGELRFALPVRRREFTPGITWAGSLEHVPAVVDYAAWIARTLEIDHYFNLQLKLVDGEPMVYEVNPRFSGTSGVATRAGVNIPEVMLDHHFGVDLRRRRFDFCDLEFRREVREIYL